MPELPNPMSAEDERDLLGRQVQAVLDLACTAEVDGRPIVPGEIYQLLIADPGDGERDRQAQAATGTPVDAAFEPGTGDQIDESSVQNQPSSQVAPTNSHSWEQPSREELIAEGRKQARIHGVVPLFADVYAEGWAEASRAAQVHIRQILALAEERAAKLAVKYEQAGAEVKELEQQVKQLTMLERMASQHATRCDANVAEADHQLALAKAAFARLRATERRTYADLLDEKVTLENRVDELEDTVVRLTESESGALVLAEGKVRRLERQRQAVLDVLREESSLDPAAVLAVLDGEGEEK
jgi:hypothetical protein